MITLIRTANIVSGSQLGAAYGWANKAASFLHEHHQIDVKVLSPIGGNPNRLAWMVTASDMAEYERKMLAYSTDPLYHELLAGARDLFIPGSIEDTIWRSK